MEGISGEGLAYIMPPKVFRYRKAAEKKRESQSTPATRRKKKKKTLAKPEVGDTSMDDEAWTALLESINHHEVS